MSNQDPSQTPDPNNGEETPRKRGIRGILGRSAVKKAAGADSDGNQPVSKEGSKGFSLDALVEGLQRSPGKYLSKEGQFNKRFSVEDVSLAQTTLKDGSREVLSRLLFVGDSVLGLTASFDKDNKLTTTRVIVLPFGTNETDANGRNSGSARVIASFGVADAKEEFDKTGIHKEWTKLSIGREQVRGDSGVEDMAVSRQHLDVILGTNGFVDLENTSLNGTGVLGMNDLMDRMPGSSLDETTLLHASILQARLEARPGLWSSDFAGQQVVYQ